MRFFCSLLDERLKESQRQVLDLRQQLQEAVDVGEQQKAHFRSSIEQLRYELQSAVTARESVLSRSKQELNDREIRVARLEETIEQLETANKQQEQVRVTSVVFVVFHDVGAVLQTLLDMNDELESARKERVIVDAAVRQVRELLSTRESRRGRAFYDSEPVARQPITTLVRTLERAFHEADDDVSQQMERSDQVG